MADMTEEHRLAVALAYQRAADVDLIHEAICDAGVDLYSSHVDLYSSHRDYARSVAAAILKLAPADALAELARLRSKVEAADELAEVATLCRAVLGKAIMALMGRGRDELFLADKINKADNKLRAALTAYEEAGK